jgi:hypothetical protein
MEADPAKFPSPDWKFREYRGVTLSWNVTRDYNKLTSSLLCLPGMKGEGQPIENLNYKRHCSNVTTKNLK